MARTITYQPSQIADPPFTRFLFSDTRMAWLWAIVRIYMAYTWITAGFGKLNNPAWVNTGDALKGYWLNALKTDPKPVITFDGYRAFIQFLVDTQAWTWFAKLVIAGELLGRRRAVAWRVHGYRRDLRLDELELYDRGHLGDG